MKRIVTGALAVLACTGLASPASASERSAQLVNSFQVFCTLEAPNFERLVQQATAMKLPERQSLESPHQGDQFARSRSWLVGLNSGPHELATSEAHGPRVDVQTCGIAAPDADADEVRQDLATHMKLGEPVSVKNTPDGKLRTTTWEVKAPTATFLVMLADGLPAKTRGIYLTFLHSTPKP